MGTEFHDELLIHLSPARDAALNLNCMKTVVVAFVPVASPSPVASIPGGTLCVPQILALVRK